MTVAIHHSQSDEIQFLCHFLTSFHLVKVYDFIDLVYFSKNNHFICHHYDKIVNKSQGY